MERYRQEQDALYQKLKGSLMDPDALFTAVVKTIRHDYPDFKARYKHFMPGEYHTYVFTRYRYGSLTLEILDLRRCVEGDEDACWNLFPYLVDRERTLSGLLNGEGSCVLFTKNNCERRHSMPNACQESLTDPKEIAMLREEMEVYRANYGRVLVYQPPMPLDDRLTASTELVLTDTFCEDEEEQFVAMCQRCGGKVITIGRPTMGTLDYFDPVRLSIGTEHIDDILADLGQALDQV